MNHKAIRVFAPATIANLGAGYDVLGIAIDTPGDVVVASRTKEPGLHFHLRRTRAAQQLSRTTNVAAHVATLMLDELRPAFGIDLTLHKLMPIGSGLGSSAASSVAAVVAVNALLPAPLKRTELLRFAVEGERLATGSPHADNVAPCLLGGAQLIRSYTPLDVVALPVRNAIYWVVVHPQLTVRTKDARRILPNTITLHAAIRQWGNVGGIVAGLARGDATLVGRSTEDIVIEPHRAKLVRGFHEVKLAALRAGALGCSLSGSGPSMFAVASSLSSAKHIASVMKRAFSLGSNVKSTAFISKINMHGATPRLSISRRT